MSAKEKNGFVLVEYVLGSVAVMHVPINDEYAFCAHRLCGVCRHSNVVEEVFDYLNKKVTALVQAGVGSGQIVVDPGFGFGKKLEHNVSLLTKLTKFRELGCPILVGLSRKSMLGLITEKQDPADRLGSSVAAAIFAVGQGADIVRVHDVNETRDALVAWQFFSEGTLSEQCK